ncbi:molybdate ABC transporter substrate-binding protein [Streptomyces sp. NBC_00306]|uniref:molybdate ABC transporter substrate-binding protein n=1 Tax=Streptomyces sp. NBC_00306 TaxID=2975708 RepID=UPI002E2D65F2|nr:molybdate ABC transporter substrate-binding protein [Streptomyces sp. NBC_00306]
MPLTPTRHRTAVTVLATALLVPLSACGSNGAKSVAGGAKAAPPVSAASKANLTVLADASLADVFKTVGAAYEKDNPGIKIIFSFAGSQELAAQVNQGASMDALVTADTQTMGGLKGDTDTPTIIATDRLVIATAEGNPAEVENLDDLADPALKVVLASPDVPAGRYSLQLLDAQNIDVTPVSLEPDVRAVLNKLELGEADAGLVYKSDAETATAAVDAIEIADVQNAITKYPAAAIKDAENASAAAAFVKWLRSPAALKILQDAGFQKP